MYTVTKEQYVVLRERFERILASEQNRLDERLLSTLEKFKTLNHVAPVWSCSGHFEDESGSNKKETYIIFAITKEGNKFLKALESARKSYGNIFGSRPALKLEGTELLWHFDKSHYEQLYPAWIISVTGAPDALKKRTEFFIEFMEKAIMFAGGAVATVRKHKPSEVTLYRLEHIGTGLVRYIFLRNEMDDETVLKNFKTRLRAIWKSAVSVRDIKHYIPNYQDVKNHMLNSTKAGYVISKIEHSAPAIDRASLLAETRKMNNVELENYRLRNM